MTLVLKTLKLWQHGMYSFTQDFYQLGFFGLGLLGIGSLIEEV